MAAPFIFFVLLEIVSLSIGVYSYEPAPMQDFCVADPTNLAAVRVNGMACKNPTFVQAEDFFYSGLHISGDTRNNYGYRLTHHTLTLEQPKYSVFAEKEPSIAIQLRPDPQNRLITKVLQRGDVFVFPVGLVHFQRNMGHSNASAIAALSSQNPGVISITNTIFGPIPPLSTERLAHTFHVDNKTVNRMKRKSSSIHE
ncbi:putative germin-like protein 2-1 [Tanacetum coccineum]